MSLHFIGIRDFPVLHRQFSTPKNSPKSPNFRLSENPTSTSTQDLARDSKDVLIQRLNDIALRLVTGENLKDEDITALHIDVDRMERVMRSTTGSHREESLPGGRSRSSTTTISRDNEDDPFWPPFSPSRKVTMRLPDSPTRSSPSNSLHHPPKSHDMSPQKAALLAQEADSLREALSHIIAELKARREESSHIHSLLITRAETAAQRIISLESAIKDIDADLEATQSELSFLRLQMRALEVQGMQYIPFNADEELSESIKNWKLDWADIDQRTRARRRKCRDLIEGNGAGTEPETETGLGTGTPVGSFSESGTVVDGLR
jgi:hypothetical protein